jgi:O-6-methylguanine DNA methyltransferase
MEIIDTDFGLFKTLSKKGIIYESYFVFKGVVTADKTIKDYLNLTNGYVLTGTAFQKLVWEQIKKIPYGETRTYSQIAELIGQPKSYRAVANACGQNKLAVIIPCHRVVGKNNLGGYKWGIEVKKALLELEKN